MICRTDRSADRPASFLSLNLKAQEVKNLILFTLIISTILFVVFVLASGTRWFSKHKLSNGVLVALSLVVFIGSVCLIVLNDYQHLGMKDVVQSQRVNIYSAVPQAAGQPPAIPFLVLHQDVGKDRLYIYNVNGKGKPEMKHSAITDQNRFKETNQSPYLSVNKTRRIYKNAFYQNLFALSGSNDVLLSTQNVFYLPKNHQVLSVQEVKNLEQKMKKKQEMMKSANSKTLHQ